MFGKFYGVSVGPGDPELMTIKAVNTIKKCEVIAFPGKDVLDAVAYNIASKNIDMSDKAVLPLKMPMSSDKAIVRKAHDEAVDIIKKHLENGRDVAFLVLGDVTIYSTYMYLHKIISTQGFETEIISGVTSFCAAAATSNVALCQWDEKLVIVPSRHHLPERFESDKNYVLMKAGKCLSQIKSKANESNRKTICIENCGMPDEHVLVGADNIPDELSYYTIVIIK